MNDTKRPLKVFLCYAHSDKDTVKALDGRVALRDFRRAYRNHTRLASNGVDMFKAGGYKRLMDALMG